MREPHSPQNTPESRDRVLQPPTPSSPHYSLIEFDILPGRTTGMATLKGLSAAGACKAATSPIYSAKDASEAPERTLHGRIESKHATACLSRRCIPPPRSSTLDRFGDSIDESPVCPTNCLIWILLIRQSFGCVLSTRELTVAKPVQAEGRV